jgi:alkylhydroperoxidase/carboxymuconolactone decarboxylase family protein YurZ
MSERTNIHVDVNVSEAGTVPIENILSAEDLAKIRAAFSLSAADNALLAGFADYSPVGPYLDGIKAVLRTALNQPATPLDLAEQEIVIMTMLMSQRMPMELALHAYVSIADEGLGISVSKIANIAMVAGIYGGVSTLSGALGALRTTLKTLKKLCQDNASLEPGNVILSIEKALA